MNLQLREWIWTHSLIIALIFSENNTFVKNSLKRPQEQQETKKGENFWQEHITREVPSEEDWLYAEKTWLL